MQSAPLNSGTEKRLEAKYKTSKNEKETGRKKRTTMMPGWEKAKLCMHMSHNCAHSTTKNVNATAPFLPFRRNVSGLQWNSSTQE